MSESNTKTTEWVNSVLLLALGVWIWWYSADFPSLDEGYPGPALFPRMIATGFVSCGILLLVTHPRLPTQFAFQIAYKRTLLLISGLLLIMLFPFLIDLVGFVPSLGILCFSFGLLLKVIWWKAALTAALTASIIYFLFVVGFGVSL